MTRILRATQSLCPICFARIPAHYRAKAAGVFLEKTCESHGFFSTLVWEGEAADFLQWCEQEKTTSIPIPATEVEKGCPFDCGLCPSHKQKGCCLLLEVTQRCNLTCPVCFASAGDRPSTDPTLADIGHWFDRIMDLGGPYNIQLSGGEPTMRDDLAEVIQIGRSKGCTFFQLNTNGLRLAEDESYLQGLARAGLNTVFLQFDGLQEMTHLRLRGKDLTAIKEKAIENCARAGLGVVLVPVLDADNLHEVGDILRYALEKLPVVRGVHFQPLSRFGRYPHPQTESRITIPTLLRAIETQSRGRMKRTDFSAPHAEHPLCSFHGDFLLQEDGQLKALEMSAKDCCNQDSCCASDRARTAVAKQWSMPKPPVPVENPDAFDRFLNRIERYRFSVSAMFFQDAWNVDLERLQECYILEWHDSKEILVPFCAYNLTTEAGQALYRPSPDPVHNDD